jgi:thioesterase domain-containing protein
MKLRSRRGQLRLQNAVSDAPVREIKYVRKSYVRAIRRYRPRPYLGKLTLLVSEQRWGRNLNLGWQALARGGIEIHRLPGDHRTYLSENVEITAKKLQECLEKAEKEESQPLGTGTNSMLGKTSGCGASIDVPKFS